MNTNNGLRVGLISDTHGLLRPEARAFLVGCDYIVHGGDVGEPKILDELAFLAPLLGGALGALVYRFVTPGWARGPGDPGGPGT